MKKFSVSLTMSALALVLGLAILGCATSGGTTTASTMSAEQLPDPVAAEQLAAEFNAIREGTATVNGATVTLGRIFFQILPNGNLGFDDPRFRGFDDPSHPNAAFEGTWIKTRDIIVPAGVTLDISADDSRLLLGTMTFTVNGTVITRSGGVGLEDNAGEVTINGNGTIYLKGKGSLFGTIQSNRNVDRQKLILDGVTLVGVDDNNSALVVVGEGGEFIMKSGKIMGNSTSSNGGGVNVERGTFTMEGGEIFDNSVQGEQAKGGGVNVFRGTFTMYGGAIYGNSAQGDMAFGGGVRMEGDSCTFTMVGGRIQGNTASDGYAANTLNGSSVQAGASLSANGSAKWGTGGTYTIGGVPQTSGSDISLIGGVANDDTLIAIPAR